MAAGSEGTEGRPPQSSRNLRSGVERLASKLSQSPQHAIQPSALPWRIAAEDEAGLQQFSAASQSFALHTSLRCAPATRDLTLHFVCDVELRPKQPLMARIPSPFPPWHSLLSQKTARAAAGARHQALSTHASVIGTGIERYNSAGDFARFGNHIVGKSEVHAIQ